MVINLKKLLLLLDLKFLNVKIIQIINYPLYYFIKKLGIIIIFFVIISTIVYHINLLLFINHLSLFIIPI